LEQTRTFGKPSKDIVEKLGWLNSDGTEQGEVDSNVETHDDEVFVTSKRQVEVAAEKEERHSSG
jgi:hypothetical protein